MSSLLKMRTFKSLGGLVEIIAFILLKTPEKNESDLCECPFIFGDISRDTKCFSIKPPIAIKIRYDKDINFDRVALIIVIITS